MTRGDKGWAWRDRTGAIVATALSASALSLHCCHSQEVRVKRCGKSAPAGRVTGLARQTPPGARPSRKSYGVVSGGRIDCWDGSVAVWSGPFGFRVGRYRRRATAVAEKWSLTTKPGL